MPCTSGVNRRWGAVFALDEVLARGGDCLDHEERERLHESLRESIEQMKAGQTIDADVGCLPPALERSGQRKQVLAGGDSPTHLVAEKRTGRRGRPRRIVECAGMDRCATRH